MEKKTLSTALGFERMSSDCLSTALATELRRRPTSPSAQVDEIELFLNSCSLRC